MPIGLRKVKDDLLSLSLIPHPSITPQPSPFPTPHFWSSSHHGHRWLLCPKGDILTGFDRAAHSFCFQFSPAESMTLPPHSLIAPLSSLSFCLLFPFPYGIDVPIPQGSTSLISFLHSLVWLKYHHHAIDVLFSVLSPGIAAELLDWCPLPPEYHLVVPEIL